MRSRQELLALKAKIQKDILDHKVELENLKAEFEEINSELAELNEKRRLQSDQDGARFCAIFTVVAKSNLDRDCYEQLKQIVHMKLREDDK
jgi:predicted  nucleic acid-binding Zn-ribbon protein